MGCGSGFLRLHPVWKVGDETVAAMRDPFYQGLVAWYNWQCDVKAVHACVRRQRAVLLTLSFPLVNRSVRLLEYCLARRDFLVSGASCLQRLYEEVVMFKRVYLGLKDASKASRSAATSEQKLWSIGHLVDLLFVPSWGNPVCLDQMLAARSLDEFVEGLEGHKKFDGALVFTHSLEYFFLLHHERVSKGRQSPFQFCIGRGGARLPCQTRKEFASVLGSRERNQPWMSFSPL